MKRLIALTAVVFVALAMALPALAARPRQVLVSVIFQQGTGAAQFIQSTVDARALPVRLSAGDFRRGVVVRDDNGAVLRIRGKAVRTLNLKHSQTFMLSGVTLGKANGAKVRTVHLFVAVFTGHDWAHYYDDGLVCTMYTGLVECLEMRDNSTN